MRTALDITEDKFFRMNEVDLCRLSSKVLVNNWLDRTNQLLILISQITS